MAGLEAALSAVSLCGFSPSKSSFFAKVSCSFISIRILNPASALSLNFPLGIVLNPAGKSLFSVWCSATEGATLESSAEKTKEPNLRRKLFVLNLPWSLTVADIKELFGQCGPVADVEIMKHKDGKKRGFAFVTMATGEAAVAAADKLDGQEVSGRVIRVQVATKFKSPPTPSMPAASKETRFKLYVSNLAWKVRSTHLREFFSADFNPVSVRVVFDSSTGRAAGYAFVSFATKEEAESAVSALNGKELMGRPVRLKFSDKNIEASRSGTLHEDGESKGKAEE